MRRRFAEYINKGNKEADSQLKVACTELRDIGTKILKNHHLTLENIDILGKLITEKCAYDKQQLIVCNLVELREKISSHKINNLGGKPIFVICLDENSAKTTFCLVKQSGAIVCLYKDFSKNVKDSKYIDDVLKEHFGKNLQFKINTDVDIARDQKKLDDLCLKTLEKMMMYLKSNEKENFISSFDDPENSFFECLKREVLSLKDGLFSLVEDGYYTTITSDIDELSKDTEFKKAIKELIDGIPFIEEVDLFKRYHNLLKEFVEMDEDDIDFESEPIKELQDKIQITREVVFSKVEKFKLTMTKNENGVHLLDIQKNFPSQMDKFTKIFEPLVRSEADEQLHEVLKKISSKLDLDYTKLENFFNVKENLKNDNNDSIPSVENIEHVIDALPELDCKNRDSSIHQKRKEILAKIEIKKSDTLSIESLKKAYFQTKIRHALWANEKPTNIYEWSVSKKGKLTDLEIFEAIAVLDRANELTTGGHKLRDTQILSVLTFLQQKDKGQLTQIQTGEGKTTIVAILAAIEALKGKKVDVITSNPVLALDGIRDKKLFYDLLNLTVATNNLDENYKCGPRECYKSDIVYGSISNFQFDYLKDSFLGLNTRAERRFESIILDEVDSMIIDNASHIAKLSEEVPGMESLKYIYIKIWQELHKAEEKIELEFRERLNIKAKEIGQKTQWDSEAQCVFTKFQDELKESINQIFKDHITATNPTKIDIIPSHIQEYADTSLDKWITSALEAKFIYKEDEQYVIRLKNDESVIQPVDYANTGMTLKNTIWQHGLHQFLQLKHNLHLTSESLTSCFISNLGYINKYGHHIFGLTGTLGSEAEQGLLSSIYNVGFAKIPTYREKKFSEIDGEIVDDEEFSIEIANNVLSKVNEGRAVLIICETIKDANAIREVMKNKSDKDIKTFLDEENAQVTEEQLDCGDIVIATNIAGRGTDFKTSAELESKGGLHVCVAFLPCNKRVEDQAFGRTARQGNHGTAQLIIKASEVDKLGVDSDCFEDIKKVRDQREKERIQLIQEIKIPELKFQDKLFELFSALYSKLHTDFGNAREHKFVLDDLKEFWAFWLNKQNYENSGIINKNLDDEFKKFEVEAEKVIKGEISFNPYYSIKQAEYFISSKGELKKAEESLNHAISISKNPEILHSAYMKLFEIAIENGGVFADKCRNAIGKVLHISNVEPDRNYKQKAKKYLILAQEAIQKELDYIEKLFGDEEFPIILGGDINNENNVKKNLFIKHLTSKGQTLSLTKNHVDSLISQIDKHDSGLSIGCRVPNYFSNLKPQNENEEKIKESITTAELADLARNGANVTYALKELHDICPEIATAAQIQVGGGIALIATGICFPPALFITSQIGATMITEGVCDVAIELINQNSDGKFNKESYIKGKVISYGLSLVTVGINTALQYPKILEKAKNACRWISETLRKCPFLEEVCEQLAKHFDKLADLFEKLETISKLRNFRHFEKLSHLNTSQQATLSGVTSFCETVTTSVENALMSKIFTMWLLEEGPVLGVEFNQSARVHQEERKVRKTKNHSQKESSVVEKVKTKNDIIQHMQNKTTELLQSMAYEVTKKLFQDTFVNYKIHILVIILSIIMSFFLMRALW